jgi:hypothetical protein
MVKNTQRRKRRSRAPSSGESFDISSYSGNLRFTTPRASVIRRATSPLVLTKGLVDAGSAVIFEASQSINWSEISALYDQYCIDKVQYVIELATPFLSNGVYPYCAIAPDYTDATAPTSEVGVLELAQAKVFQFGPDRTRLSVTVKPRAAMAAYQSGISSGYAVPNGDTWFSSDNSTVDHYGLKYWLRDYNNTINATTALRAFAVFHFKVRSSR